MWIHIVIFVIILTALIGWKKGWIPSEGVGGREGVRLFAAVALAGDLLGGILTFGSNGRQVYSEGYKMEKEETGSYEEKFKVSVDGAEAGSLYIQVPEKEMAEPEEQKPADQLTKEETRKRKLQDAVAMYNLEKNDPEFYYLPAVWEGKRLEWEKPADTTGTILAGIFLAASLVLLVMKGREEQAALQKKYEELLMDYPGLVMKFTLLVQAGMTARKAFQKIALDYRRKRGACKRTAYEEIMTVCYEMDSGVSESEAYRRFGERCGQVKYKTLATLLIQNLQKGSRHLSDILERESMEAWEERKEKPGFWEKPRQRSF